MGQFAAVMTLRRARSPLYGTLSALSLVKVVTLRMRQARYHRPGGRCGRVGETAAGWVTVLWWISLLIHHKFSELGRRLHRRQGPEVELREDQSRLATLGSSAFDHGQTLPADHAASGAGFSLELHWSSVREGTESFAPVVTDPSAPVIGGWVHWVVYGIPGDVLRIPPGDGQESQQGLNSKEVRADARGPRSRARHATLLPSPARPGRSPGARGRADRRPTRGGDRFACDQLCSWR